MIHERTFYANDMPNRGQQGCFRFSSVASMHHSVLLVPLFGVLLTCAMLCPGSLPALRVMSSVVNLFCAVLLLRTFDDTGSGHQSGEFSL